MQTDDFHESLRDDVRKHLATIQAAVDDLKDAATDGDAVVAHEIRNLEPDDARDLEALLGANPPTLPGGGTLRIVRLPDQERDGREVVQLIVSVDAP